MKFFKFLNCALFLTLFSFSFNTVEAQWRGDPASNPLNDNDIVSNMFRTGNVAVGAKNPFPSDIKLYVKGRFTQTFSGNLGGQTFNDRWSSLGSNLGTNNPTQVYGLIRQWNSRFLTTGIKGGLNALIAWGGNARLDFDYTNSNNINSTKMSILSNGRVGIGTTSPNTNLSVRGRVRGAADVNETEYTEISHGGAAGYINTVGDGPLDFRHDNRTFMRLTRLGNTGRLSVNTINSNFTLDVNGTAGCTLGFWSGSDRRYKKDIQRIDNALEKVRALEGVGYKFTQKEVNGLNFEQAKDKEHLGFIAQDLEKIMPQLVQKDDAGYYAVNYDGVIPILVEALKEQDEVVQEQSELIENQQTEMEDLKDRIEKLEALVESVVVQEGSKKETPTSQIQNTAVLKQNAPNPFDALTTISYELPSNISSADLVIFDLNGKMLKSYSVFKSGTIDFDASNLANGTYLYAIMKDGETIARQKMVVQK